MRLFLFENISCILYTLYIPLDMAKKKKLIEIEENDFKSLSIQAATKGKNLKHYIEENLSKLASKKITVAK